MKKKILIGITVGILIILGIVINIINQSDSKSINFIPNQEEEILVQIVIVQIEGEVMKPGIYEMSSEHRVNDLINIAGGFKPNADKNINLVQKLSDGMVVKVSTKGDGETPSSKISINKATLKELDTLEGIGQTIANRIIEYRETKGAFTNVNQLLEISGISENILAKIIDKICL
jgi:competence protein ComEA